MMLTFQLAILQSVWF